MMKKKENVYIFSSTYFHVLEKHIGVLFLFQKFLDLKKSSGPLGVDKIMQICIRHTSKKHPSLFFYPKFKRIFFLFFSFIPIFNTNIRINSVIYIQYVRFCTAFSGGVAKQANCLTVATNIHQEHEQI